MQPLNDTPPTKKTVLHPLQSKTRNWEVAFYEVPDYNKKLYFAYIRMSTGKQTQEKSPEMQRKYIKLYAKELWIDYDKQIIELGDPGESGFKVRVENWKNIVTKRRGFKKLWDHVNLCRVPCEVFVYDISRYSRNTEIGVTELSIALWLHWKEYKKIEKFHIAESWKIYDSETEVSEIIDDIKAKMQESEGKRRKSNSNIKVSLEEQVLPKMASSKLSAERVFEWISEGGVEWVRKWENFVHIERAMDMRIEWATLEEIHNYLTKNGLNYGIWNMNRTIFSNSVFSGIYCPKKWKNKWEVTEIRFLDDNPPIKPEKWEKLQATIHNRATYASRQPAGEFLKPIISIMRFIGDTDGHFTFYSQKWYWYIRYRSKSGHIAQIPLLEILREFIKQQWEILFEIFYGIAKACYNKKNPDDITGFPAKREFLDKKRVRKMLWKQLYTLWKNTNFHNEVTHEEFHSMNFSALFDRAMNYCDVHDVDFTSLEQEQWYDLYFVAIIEQNIYLGDNDIRNVLMRWLSKTDREKIDNQKTYIAHLEEQIKQKEERIEETDNWIIDTLPNKEIMERAEHKQESLRNDIVSIRGEIDGLKGMTDIEKQIRRLPNIIRKIGELTKKPFKEKDFKRDYKDIVKLLELTCGELSVSKEKTLKIGLYEILERLRNIDNLNWQSGSESNWDQGLWRPLY